MSVGVCSLVLLSLSFHLIWAQSVPPGPPIIGAPSTATEGETIYFVCTSYDGQPPADITWMRVDGTVISPSFKTEVSYVTFEGNTTSVSEHVYEFIANRLHNGMLFVCEAANSLLTLTTNTNFTIYVTPSPPSLTQETEVIEGEDMTWQCVVDGAYPIPKIFWIFNDSSLSEGITEQYHDYGDFTTKMTSILTRTFMRTDSGGTLQCEVSHETYHTVRHITGLNIMVNFVADITAPQISYEASIHDNIILLCNIGDARPNVTSIHWYHDGDVVPAGTARFSVSDPTSPSLEISDLQLEDDGDYICSAVSDVGESNTTVITLDVWYAPQSIEVEPVFVEAVLGGYFSIWCSALANPIAAYHWTFHNETIETGNKLLKETIKKTDAGEYICVANNDRGTVMISVTVEVHYKPEPIQSQYSYQVEFGDTISLVCETDSVPPTNNYVWSYNGDHVAKTGVELIVDVTSDSLGTYMCYAENSVGVSDVPINFKLELKDTDGGTGTGTVGASKEEQLSTGATAALALATIFGILVIIIIIVCCVAQGLCSGLPCLRKRETKIRVAPEKPTPDIPRFVERHSPEKGVHSVVSRKDVKPIIPHKYHHDISDEYHEAKFSCESSRYQSLPLRRPHLMGTLALKKNTIPSISNGPIISVYDDSYRAPAPHQLHSLVTPISRPNRLPALETIYTYDEEECKRKKRRKTKKRLNEEIQGTMINSRSRRNEVDDLKHSTKHSKHRKSRHRESNQSEEGQRSRIVFQRTEKETIKVVVPRPTSLDS